ncbi:MAG: hypothetical protein QGH39_12315 [Candidatus Thermoplasmatota archaeon]|jgi:hypothetical protein|nr:hypothetical protein [Candidatus Thermoplasmatota archaeon]
MVKIKKKFIVIGVIVVLLLAGIIYIVSWSQDDSVNRLFIGNIVANSNNTGISVEAVADPNGPSSAEGNGRIKILYENTEVYSESLPFNADRALKEIPYSEFVVGNGDYEIEVAYKDKKDNSTYSIEWVLEYIYVGTNYEKIRTNTEDNLNIVIFPLGGDLSSEFSMAKEFKTYLDDHSISEEIEAEFKKHDIDFKDEGEMNVIKSNQRDWIFSNATDTFLIREEGNVLKVYTFSGVKAKPLGIDIDLTIYLDGVKVHEKNVHAADVPFVFFNYGGYDHKLGGDYRFELNAKNTFVSDDSPFSGSISASLTQEINRLPTAIVGAGFSYNAVGEQYEKTVKFKLMDVGDEYPIDFDAGGSLNDGPLTYEWDWDYFDQWNEENEEFDVEDTGATASHSFHIVAGGSHEYVGLRVIGDKEVDMEGKGVVEKEYNIVIIHIEFTL